MTQPLPAPVAGVPFDVQTAAGRVSAYQLGEGRTVLLLHSFNAAGSGIELAPLASRLASTLENALELRNGLVDGAREVREYWERFWSQALAGFKAVADTEAEQRTGIGRKESSDGDRG